MAKKSPEAFVAIAARICPNDVQLTFEQAIPGGMSLEDYSLRAGPGNLDGAVGGVSA